jgi:hypothetical protein
MSNGSKALFTMYRHIYSDMFRHIWNTTRGYYIVENHISASMYLSLVIIFHPGSIIHMITILWPF